MRAIWSARLVWQADSQKDEAAMLPGSSPSSPSLIRAKSTATPPTVTLASASTSPPSANATTSKATKTTLRPLSEFDAGLNSSAAWAANRAQAHDALSDDEGESSDEGEKYTRGRPARALYPFEGKSEFRELTVKAGDALTIIRDDAGDGWSLVRCGREVGLLPRTYYTFTSEFVRSPNDDDKRHSFDSDASTPRGGSPARKDEGHHPHHAPATPLIPQTTGEWLRTLPSFRRSLLGGKSFNRFSSFVTSGAEDFVLNGAEEEPDVVAPGHARAATDASTFSVESVQATIEADKHYVDVGPAWKAKVPPFRVLVHSPTKVNSGFAPAYMVYSVTSLFHPDPDADTDEERPLGGHSRSGSTVTVHHGPDTLVRVTVSRRFSHFVALHTALLRSLPGLALPPLPEKQYAGRFSNDFVEARRMELERYLARLVRHPLVRYAGIVTAFLSCDDDTEWKNILQAQLTRPQAGSSFYSRVFHPAFGVDVEDAAIVADRFDSHAKAVGRGVQDLRNVFVRVRDARIEMSKAERSLAYSLLSLITSRPLASASPTDDDPEEHDPHRPQGLMNEDGAWCWRDHCEECLKLTKALQKTADTLQIVGDLYDDHARRRQLATHEALKGVAHPSTLYAAVVDTHRSTLSRYNNDGLPGAPEENLASRCETVLNTTMAEIDTYHTQKIEDFGGLAREHLDGEIGLYEQILARLYTARNTFDQAEYDGPRQPSLYERELAQPRTGAAPLPQPTPHVYDSAPMRPVTAALQDGVGLLASAAGRASVLGKLW